MTDSISNSVIETFTLTEKSFDCLFKTVVSSGGIYTCKLSSDYPIEFNILNTPSNGIEIKLGEVVFGKITFERSFELGRLPPKDSACLAKTMNAVISKIISLGVAS